MTRNDLLALAARVEAATGADRMLDAQIHIALGLPVRECADEDGCLYQQLASVPRYSASLDAAASLQHPGWRLVALGCYGGRWYCVLANEQNDTVAGDAYDEPRARTAAAIRAKAQEARDE